MRRPAANSVPAKPERALDDDARSELTRLPNVLEVYPQIRFPTEVRYNGNSYSTIVAGVPDSARGNGSYDGIQGSFFSGPNADEAILQIEFAKDLSEQTPTLIGKDLVVRYAEREALAHVAEHASGGLRFHDLRHSYATWLVSDGVPVNIVQRVVGHEQASTTLNRYTHTPDGDEERVLAAFGAPGDFSPTPEDQPDIDEGEEDESCSP